MRTSIVLLLSLIHIYSIAYIIKSDDNEILVIHNSKNEDINVEVEKGAPWNVLVDKYNSGVEVIDVIDKNIIKVSAISTFVAIR